LLMPSLHMYFMYFFNVQNDRLGYYFSLVFYQLLVMVFVAFFSSTGLALICIYGIAGLYFLRQQTEKWNTAGVIQDNCIKSFVWTDAPKIYVLNEAAYYKSIYVFREDERLAWALSLFKHYKHPERIVHVFSSFSQSLDDSTLVEIRNDSTLHVADITGGWLMRGSFGASDYGNEDFSTKIDQGNPGYEVVFHHKTPGAIYIYSGPSGYRNLSGF
jgi:hypothetical protein